MSLREIKADVIDELEENLELIAANHALSDTADAFEDVARGFEALGCCKLLLEMNPSRLHRDLVWAGFARLRFLRRSANEGNTSDHHLARSRCDSFFCTIAAGDFAMADEIGNLSPQAWTPEGEYEEDFLYFQFLHLVLRGAPPTALSPLVDQTKVAQGGPSPRLAVMEAFAAGDPDAFEEAFTALVDARNDRVDADKATFADVVTFGPRAAVFVEGLALLRLAELRRLGPRRQEYPRCPYAARAVSVSPRPEDPFDLL